MPPEMEPSVLNGSSTPNHAEKWEQQNGGPRPKEDLRKRIRAALPQVLATSAKNVLLLGYGMTLGFPTIVIPAVSWRPLEAGAASDNATLLAGNDTAQADPGQLTLSDAEVSWFSSINLICVPLGCLLSGPLASPFGRRPAMMLVNLPLLAAWLLFHYAQSVGMLYAGLALAGASGGLLEAPVLTYVAEITEPRFRGALSATSSTSVIVGVFTQFLLGKLLPWRTVALVNLVCPVAAVVALCFVPESPHWLVGKGRIAAAEKALCWLRGWVQPDDVRQELNELVASMGSTAKVGATAETQQQQQPAWRNYLKRTFIRPYLLVSTSFAIGHFCGMTTVQTYAVKLFSQLGAPADSYTATLLMGLAQLLGAVAGVCSVHRFGKRPLSLASAAGNGVCFVVVAILAYHNGTGDKSASTWTPSLILVAASFMSHFGLRMLPWILIGEVYPAEVRGTASGASGSMGYVLGFAANKSFLSLVHTLSLAGTLLLYGCVSLLGCVLLFFVLPETEGHSLQEIEAHFARTDGRCCQPGGGLTRRGRHRKQLEQAPAHAQPQADPRWAAANPALELNETHI